MEKISIVIADDHHILLDGLNALLKKQKDMDILGLYDTGDTLLTALSTLHPDVAVVDINMPGGGTKLAETITKQYPSVSIICLSMYDDTSHIMDMIDAGVSGYLLKNVNDKELLEAIRTVAGGKMYFQAEVSDKITLEAIRQRKAGQEEQPHLTEREVEILKLISKEYSNADIAKELFISERTVETHRKNMLRKTKTKTIVGLLRFGMDNGVI